MPQERSDSIAEGMSATTPAGGRDRVAAIVAVARDVARAGLDIQAVMDLLARRTQELTRAEGAAVELAEEDEMVSRSGSGIAAVHVGLRQKISASLSGLCVTTGDIQICNDSEGDPRVDQDVARTIGLRSMIAVPLHHGGQVAGVLKVMSRKPSAFTDEDVDTLQLMTPYLAAALSNASEMQATQELIAERTAAYERERRSAERLKELDALRTNFVSIVSHELRNPLASIRGFASLMRDKPDSISPDERRTFVDAIVHQSDRVAKLIEDVLAVSQMESGDFTSVYIHYDMPKWL